MTEFRLPPNSRIRKGVTHKAPAGAAETRTFRIYRFDPSSGENPRVDTFELDVVAPFSGDTGNPVAQAELTGTGDGRLFGFFAPTNMNNVPPSFIDQIDPRSAKVLSSVLLPDVIEGGGWAFGFWGGDFYTFTAPDNNTTVVTRYKPSDGSVTQVATAPSGVVIVGAGVSTCAPQE